MLEANQYSAKLVFEGAKIFSSDHLFGLMTDANEALGLTAIDADSSGDVLARTVTDKAIATFRQIASAQETLLVLSLEATPDQNDEEAAQRLLAGYLRPVLADLPASHVEWLDTGARIPRAAFLAALCPVEESTSEKAIQQDTSDMTAQSATAIETATITSLAPRRVKAGAVKRTARPAAGQHAKIKAVANSAIVHSRHHFEETGAGCFVPVNNAIFADLLPVVGRQARIEAANGNGPRAFSSKDARISLQEGNLRANLLREVTEDELAEAEQSRGPIPLEVRLSTWAVSLSVATISLPVAAPVLVYNVVKGEDLRVASLAMGLAGFFTALSGTGAFASILPF